MTTGAPPAASGPSLAEQGDTWGDAFLDALEPVLAKFRNTRERREALGLLRALRLAKSLDTCEELLRSGRAPRSVLDAEWAKAYGLC